MGRKFFQNSIQVVALARENDDQTIDLVNATTPLTTIDTAHQQVHLGNMYTIGYRWENQADNAILYLSFEVPSGYAAHMIYGASSTGKAYISFYENASISGGTEIITANKNRFSSNAANVTIRRDVSISTTGSAFPVAGLMGSGGKHSPIGGETGLDVEWILNQNTKYLLSIQNKGGASQDVALMFLFYEKAV